MLKIPAEVAKFAGADNVKIYEQFRDYFNHYRAFSQDAKVTYDESKSLDEKDAIMNKKLLEEVKRVGGVNFDDNSLSMEAFATNPSVSWATFAVIGTMIDAIIPDTIIESTGLYNDVRVGGYGDNFAFDVKPRDLFVVSKHGRGRRLTELKKQFTGQVTITPELREISVQASLYKILCGKESIAELAMKAVRSVETEMTKDIYFAFDEAMRNLPDTPVNQQLIATGQSGPYYQ